MLPLLLHPLRLQPRVIVHSKLEVPQLFGPLFILEHQSIQAAAGHLHDRGVACIKAQDNQRFQRLLKSQRIGGGLL